MTAEADTFSETFRNMQTHVDPKAHAETFLNPHMDNCGIMDINNSSDCLDSELSKTLTLEVINTTSPQTLPLALGNQPATTYPLEAPAQTVEFETPSNYGPLTSSPNPITVSSSIPVEKEKKYALRSSGRPRFPLHLRKSSRLHRSIEDVGKGAGRDRGREEDETLEEKIWMVKEEDHAGGNKEKRSSLEVPLTTPTCHTDTPLTSTEPKPATKPLLKPGLKLGHRPGPKSRCKPPLKYVHKAAPKSILKQRLAAQALRQSAASDLSFKSAPSAPLLTMKKELDADLGICPPSNSKKRCYVGVRKIVVKVPRIPVSLSRRQKSYKISSLETVTGAEKSNDGSPEGSEATREPTALLRMKNNGKSVMVMFPPGELPVILKRRRGRPPKQALPGMQVEVPSTGTPGVIGDQPKKPRRRRRIKLPCPYPSYVNDTNDVKTEYGDVLSKLAFLNRQPPTTGRCSPPRCWTPSEPESFHIPLENPGISTLLHRLTGSRRPRGGRGGGLGRGGGAAGGVMGSDCNKSTFSDFFESIGKKQKLNLLSQHGLPRKRRKGVGGGVGRGGGMVGTEAGGEKIVRKRRMKKNGAFKGGVVSMGQQWPNGTGGWDEEGAMDKERALGGYQLCGSPRGGLSSCSVGRGGVYCSPGGSKGAGLAGEDSQGLFAGYFRSLLDSDDSSDLLDISSQTEPRKSSSCTYDPSSSAASHSWSPPFSKWNTKGTNAGLEGSAQTHCSTARPPYSYGTLAQISPTTSTYPKSNPPSLSHSPSSPHPASYGHYPSGYSYSPPVGMQRSSDCSFGYGLPHGSGKGTPANQMGYSNYQSTTKRGYGGYPAISHSPMGRVESAGPTSPGGGYMSVVKGIPFSSSAPEGYRQLNSNQWSCRQAFGGWSAGNFGSQYHGYSEYGSSESKDILDISNYTPQKAKRQPFPESLSESSSDSSHVGSTATFTGPSSTGGSFKQNEAVSMGGGPSSLSSLEKLMMDWHESASGSSYNWSQDVLFQGGGTSKPGRGRRKRTELLLEKEGCSALHSDSPSSPSPTAAPGPKRGGAGGRGRGSRGGRGGMSTCQRDRPTGSKGRGKMASTSGLMLSAGGTEGSGLFQEGLDYYSGDSSSLSPQTTPNPVPPSSYLPDTCEYTSPYSAHPSTPSSEERYPALFPGESSSSLSPSVSSPPYPPKPTPPPNQSYHLLPSRTFSPSCSPSPRLTPHCGTALSPSQRPPPKDTQFSQYDSPSNCSSPYWYGQTSHSSSPSPHSNSALHANSNPHVSPHGNAHPNSLTNPAVNTHAHMSDTQHQTHTNMSSHTSTHSVTHLQSSQPHLNAQLPTHSHPSPGLHSTPLLYEERTAPASMAPHKRDLVPHSMSTGFRQGPLPHSPYSKPPLDASPHQEETSGYSLPQQSYQGGGHRYPPQTAQGGGVLCQLLDPASDDSFSVTSL